MSIDNAALERQLLENTAIQQVRVEGDGYHYFLNIVSDEFIGKSVVQRQKWVYKQLDQHIKDGSLHALSMKTWTIDEWEKQSG